MTIYVQTIADDIFISYTNASHANVHRKSVHDNPLTTTNNDETFLNFSKILKCFIDTCIMISISGSNLKSIILCYPSNTSES